MLVYEKYECFIMQILVVFVSCESCGNSQLHITELHTLHCYEMLIKNYYTCHGTNCM